MQTTDLPTGSARTRSTRRIPDEGIEAGWSLEVSADDVWLIEGAE
jgi:hypothetical protein